MPSAVTVGTAPTVNLTATHFNAVSFVDKLQNTLDREKFSLFTAVLRLWRDGLLNYQDLYAHTKDILSCVAEPEKSDLIEGFIDAMPERLQPGIRAQREQEALRERQTSLPTVGSPDLQDTGFVKRRFSNGAYQRFVNLFIVYTANWPRSAVTKEPYGNMKKLIFHTSDVLEGLRYFMSYQDLDKTRCVIE